MCERGACTVPIDPTIHPSLAGDHFGVGSRFFSLAGLPSPHLLALHMVSFSALAGVLPQCMRSAWATSHAHHKARVSVPDLGRT